MNKHQKSRSSLFLMEMIITICFFSFASAICVQCFVKAHLIDKKTIELNHAVEISQNLAEIMRGTEGDIYSIMAMYPESIQGDDDYFTLFYDSDFNPCSAGEARYAADVTLTQKNSLITIDINVTNVDELSIIYSLQATKYIDLSHG